MVAFAFPERHVVGPRQVEQERAVMKGLDFVHHASLERHESTVMRARYLFRRVESQLPIEDLKRDALSYSVRAHDGILTHDHKDDAQVHVFDERRCAVRATT